MNDKNRIIVIGGNHQNTLGVIEALGQKGVRPFVIIMSNVVSSYVLKSKYVQSGYILEYESLIIDTIIEICNNADGVVTSIACSDDAAVLLDNNHRRWPSNFSYPSARNTGELKDWTDKERMTELAASIGMDVPKSCLIHDGYIPGDIAYPCITKPTTSVYYGKKGFSKCDNRDDLISYFKNEQTEKCVQVQQYIDKEYEFQFLGCSINSGETVIIPGRTHINTTTGFNNLVFLKYDKCELEFDATIEMAKRYVRETGYSGLFSIEFMRGKDGKNYFLEMNFRNDGNGIAVTSSGTNLPYIWYLSQIGGEVQREIKYSTIKETFMMPELSFFSAMVNGEVSYREWRSDLRKANCYLTFFEDDKAPFHQLLKEQWKAVALSMIVAFTKKIHLYNFIHRLR